MGGLWGIGHTFSLVVVGILVLALRVAIPDRVGEWLELGVAVMIIALGASALIRALRRPSRVHLHKHSHDGVSHLHVHFHESETQHLGPVKTHSHALKQVGIKPFLVGAMHGLAGSGALIIIVVAQTGSVKVGLLYLTIFGIGSVGGMLLMSALVGLPFALTSRFYGIHHGLQTAAGVLSIAFGCWYGYQIWQTIL
ncbi:MAG: sulfite exporter TauE/SafE family protein [Pyrinomonadaceae bacterium]